MYSCSLDHQKGNLEAEEVSRRVSEYLKNVPKNNVPDKAQFYLVKLKERNLHFC